MIKKEIVKMFRVSVNSKMWPLKTLKKSRTRWQCFSFTGFSEIVAEKFGEKTKIKCKVIFSLKKREKKIILTV